MSGNRASMLILVVVVGWVSAACVRVPADPPPASEPPPELPLLILDRRDERLGKALNVLAAEGIETGGYSSVGISFIFVDPADEDRAVVALTTAGLGDAIAQFKRTGRR